VERGWEALTGGGGAEVGDGGAWGAVVGQESWADVGSEALCLMCVVFRGWCGGEVVCLCLFGTLDLRVMVGRAASVTQVVGGGGWVKGVVAFERSETEGGSDRWGVGRGGSHKMSAVRRSYAGIESWILAACSCQLGALL